jgi:hypothetical protein
MKKSAKLAGQVVNSNIAIGSLPTLQISLVIFPLFKKIYDGEPILGVISNIGRTIPLLQISVWCGKFVVAGHDADIGIQLLFSNNRSRVRWAVLDLSRGMEPACTDLFENISENSLKEDLSNDIKFNPPLFSFANTFKGAQMWEFVFNIRAKIL